MLIKKEIYIIISCFFLVSLFLVLFFIWPLTNEIQQKSNELVSRKQKVLVLEKEFNEVENFKNNYANYQSDLEKIDNSFVNSQDLVGIIEFLEKSAENLGVQLNLSSPSFADGGVNFQLTSSGDFPKIMLFISRLETGPYLLKIKNVDFENLKAAKEPQKKTAQIFIQVLSK